MKKGTVRFKNKKVDDLFEAEERMFATTMINL